MFFSSYLPRAMQTAALAAWHFQKLGKLTDEMSDQVLCHIGEFANPEESEEQLCIRKTTEDVITQSAFVCWLSVLNQELQSIGRVQLVTPTYNCDLNPQVLCSLSTQPAWLTTRKDIQAFERAYLPRWLLMQQESDHPLLFVVFSHGRYMKKALGLRSKVRNLDVLKIRYTKNKKRWSKEHIQKLHGPVSEKGLHMSYRTEEELFPSWGDDTCNEPKLPWSRC